MIIHINSQKEEDKIRTKLKRIFEARISIAVSVSSDSFFLFSILRALSVICSGNAGCSCYHNPVSLACVMAHKVMQAKMDDLPQALPEFGSSTLGGAVLEVEDYTTKICQHFIIS